MRSTPGISMIRPGPRTPASRPKRNTTARSYSRRIRTAAPTKAAPRMTRTTRVTRTAVITASLHVAPRARRASGPSTCPRPAVRPAEGPPVPTPARHSSHRAGAAASTAQRGAEHPTQADSARCTTAAAAPRGAARRHDAGERASTTAARATARPARHHPPHRVDEHADSGGSAGGAGAADDPVKSRHPPPPPPTPRRGRAGAGPTASSVSLPDRSSPVARSAPTAPPTTKRPTSADQDTPAGEAGARRRDAGLRLRHGTLRARFRSRARGSSSPVSTADAGWLVDPAD